MAKIVEVEDKKGLKADRPGSGEAVKGFGHAAEAPELIPPVD